MHISFPLSHFLKPLFPVHDSTLLLVCGLKHQKMTQIIYLMFSWKMDTWAFIQHSVTTPPAGFHLCVLIPTGFTFAPLLFTLVNLNVINQSNQECKTQLFAVKHSDCSLHLVTHSWLSYRGIFLIWLNTETSLAIIPAVFPSHKQWLHQLLFLDLFSWFMVYTVKYQETNTRVK